MNLNYLTLESKVKHFMQVHDACLAPLDMTWSNEKILYRYVDFIYYVRECTKRFIVGTVVLRRQGEGLGLAHQNVLIVDKDKETIERYDPHHINYTTWSSYSVMELDDCLRVLFNRFLPKFTYESPVDFCRSIPGLQRHERTTEYHQGLCVMFSLMYAEYRLSFPDITKPALIQALDSKLGQLSPQQLGDYFRQYVHRIQTDAIALYPALAEARNREELTVIARELRRRLSSEKMNAAANPDPDLYHDTYGWHVHQKTASAMLDFIKRDLDKSEAQPNFPRTVTPEDLVYLDDQLREELITELWHAKMTAQSSKLNFTGLTKLFRLLEHQSIEPLSMDVLYRSYTDARNSHLHFALPNLEIFLKHFDVIPGFDRKSKRLWRETIPDEVITELRGFIEDGSMEILINDLDMDTQDWLYDFTTDSCHTIDPSILTSVYSRAVKLGIPMYQLQNLLSSIRQI